MEHLADMIHSQSASSEGWQYEISDKKALRSECGRLGLKYIDDFIDMAIDSQFQTDLRQAANANRNKRCRFEAIACEWRTGGYTVPQDIITL